MKIVRLVKINICIMLLNAFLGAQGSLLLVGGGGEDYNSWSDEPYQWFVQQADSGKIINIDFDAASDWYPSYFISFGAQSSSHALQIASQSMANDSATYQELISAQGIFMEGGNQWEYVSTWKGTLVEDAIHYVFQQGGVIGGTSAGLAVLGAVCFDARNGSAYPEETAYNAWDGNISLTEDFLEILPGILTDSHFHPRGRLGRLVPMLAQRIVFHDQDLLGIGVDDKTALCVAPDLTAKAYGKGSVTILYQTDLSEVVSENGNPVKFTDIGFEQLVHGMQYDLAQRTPLEPDSLLELVTDLPPTPEYTEVTINGADPNSADLGEVKITKLTTDELNAWYGRLGQTAGDTTVPRAIIIPRLWSDYDFFENRLIGGIWGVATHPGFVAIYLDDNTSCHISSDGILTAHTFTYILDSHSMQYVGFPQQLVPSAPLKESNHPGMFGARLHFLRDGDQYDLKHHRIYTGLEPEQGGLPADFRLYQNHPNPFNPRTTIAFDLGKAGDIQLAVYDLKGRLINRLVNGNYQPGCHRVEWQGNDQHGNPVSSGCYFYCLKQDQHMITRKMLFLQ